MNKEKICIFGSLKKIVIVATLTVSCVMTAKNGVMFGITTHVRDYHLKHFVEADDKIAILCLKKQCLKEGHYHCYIC